MEAKDIDFDDLMRRFSERPPQDRETLSKLAKTLSAETGGGIWVVMDKTFKDSIDFNYLDDGRLYNCFVKELDKRGVVNNTDRFAIMIRAVCKHTETDRWVRADLEQLAEKLGHDSLEAASAAHILNLIQPSPQPKDGAILISLGGSVLAAAARLRASSPKGLGRQMVRADGTRVGTKHAGALGAAQWLGHVGASGVVFTRSEDGSLHAFLPQASGVPEVFKVRAVRDVEV